MGLGEILNQTVGGPGTLRFIIQPTVALLLGLRDGRNDGRLGRAPYILGLLTLKGQRKTLLKHGAAAVMVPLILAISMDIVFQYLITREVSLRAALAVGCLLVAIPYMLSRAMTNRIWRQLHGRAEQRA